MGLFRNINKKQRTYIFFAAMILLIAAMLPVSFFCENMVSDAENKSVDILGKRGTAETIDNLELKIECMGQHEIIKLWRKGSGEDGDGKKYDSDELYAFLPSGTDIGRISFYYNDKKSSVYLDGRAYTSGEFIDGIRLDDNCGLAVYGNGKNEQCRVTFVQSKNLPVAFLTTGSGSTHTLRQNKDNMESGTFKLINSDGKVDYDGKLEWVSGRGNSSWGLEKRPYLIKLKKEAGLLGMGKADKWVLIANAFDYSDGLRNQMAYSLALNTGMEYSCHLQFMDLYINEIYAGTYQLCEKIEVHPNRLDIGYLDEANEEVNQGLDFIEGTYKDSVGLAIKTPGDYSGGYILERNYGSKLTSKPFFFTTEGKEGFVVRAPQRVSDKEMAYIKGYMQSVENALLSDNGMDEVSGLYYTELIDIESWAKKFLINVITKGESIGATSSYFYKKQGDGLIYAGPAWDFDKSFARQPSISSPDGLMDSFGATRWWECVYGKPEFYGQVVECYRETFRPCLLEMTANDVDRWADYIAGSNKMNWLRWPEAARDYDFPEGMGTPDEDGIKKSAEFLKEWTKLRIDYLDSIWFGAGGA